MEPINEQPPSAHKLGASDYVDILLRVPAFILGLVFLMGSFWVARDGSYPNITGLFSALLMFLCVVLPMRPSRIALVTLSIMVIPASVDFAVRALPDLRNENYPSDIVMFYLIESVVVIWFIRKNLAAYSKKKDSN